MGTRRFLSFRYKIQIAVLVILSVTLSLYIGLASETLTSEKITSLLETSSAQAEVLASRISRKLLAEQFWIESKLGDPSSERAKAFEGKSSLQLILRSRSGKSELVYQRKGVSPELKPPQSGQLGLELSVDGHHQGIWLIKKASNGDQIASFWSQDFFEREIKSDPDSHLSLVFLSNKKVESLDADTELSIALEGELRNKTLSSSVTASRLALNGENYVLALAPVEYFPVLVSLLSSEKVALSAAQVLKTRSLYFAILVFGLTGLLGLWIGQALSKKLLLLTEETKKIAQGNLDSQIEISGSDEVGELSNSISTMAQDIKRYIGEVSQKSRMEAELKTAKTVQDLLFPEKSWNNSEFAVEGFYESASECGGDLWFYWVLDRELFFLIADATGHGAPAALITSAARATISNIQYHQVRDPEKIAEQLHRSILETSKGLILMTCFLGKANLDTGEINYVNCSHEQPLLQRADGTFDYLLNPNNPRLGDPLQEKIHFQSGRTELKKGDRLFLYTDGLIDLKDEKGRTLSGRRFEKLATEILVKPLPLAEISNEIIMRMKTNRQVSHLEDDVTMTLIQRNP